MDAGRSLSLAEWAVLAVVSERPTHGFAITLLTAPDGELGRIWRIPRPIVYRALGRLQEAGLIQPGGLEHGRGPQRTIYAVTAEGRTAVGRWLETPVGHVRDVRSHLLLKLAFLDRAGEDPTTLLTRQKAALEPIARAISTEHPGQQQGFDAIILAWRQANATAALRFLDTVMAGQAGRPAQS